MDGSDEGLYTRRAHCNGSAGVRFPHPPPIIPATLYQPEEGNHGQEITKPKLPRNLP